MEWLFELVEDSLSSASNYSVRNFTEVTEMGKPWSYAQKEKKKTLK